MALRFYVNNTLKKGCERIIRTSSQMNEITNGFFLIHLFFESGMCISKFQMMTG